ncbi:MAG: tail fiber protein [bacterium]|nr:tail fiber protein [bacterium]
MKKSILLTIVTMLIVLTSVFTGCEAGLNSNSNSQDSSQEDQFSFSDMYSKIRSLQEQVNTLSSSQSASSGSIQATLTDHDSRITQAAPAGTIVPFAGASAPAGWLPCDGSSLSRTGTYEALFQAIGTAWGTSHGSSFNVPDLRGMFLRGVSGGSSWDPDSGGRTALKTGGNSGDSVGSYQGDMYSVHSHLEYVNAGDYDYESGSRVSGANTYGDTNYRASNINTGDAGGNETRPKNVYVNYIIKY